MENLVHFVGRHVQPRLGRWKTVEDGSLDLPFGPPRLRTEPLATVAAS